MPKLCPCPMPRNHTTIEKERGKGKESLAYCFFCFPLKVNGMEPIHWLENQDEKGMLTQISILLLCRHLLKRNSGKTP